MNLPKTEALKALCIQKGLKYVGFRGNPKAPLWFIGEAPGADEDQQGVPFVGASGRELDRMLNEAGISLQECCFTNPFKVRPPNNDIDRIEELGISKDIYIEQFWEELDAFKPAFIIPLGGTPLGITVPSTIDRKDREFKISKWRGSLLTGDERLNWLHYVLPNFHPAYILREWSDRDVAVFVFRRLKEEYDYFVANGKHQPLPQRQLIAEPTPSEAKEYLHECLEHDLVSCDFELLARRVPICLGLSYSPTSAVSVSLFEGDPKDQKDLWRLIDKILATKRVIGQNWTTFDANWAEAIGLNSGMGRVSDCLVRHHVLHVELSHKLDWQVCQYTREPYYKDEGRGWQAREGLKKLKLYNCKDAACTLEVHEEQDIEFAEQPNLRRFCDEYAMPLARRFFYISKRGTLTNGENVARLRAEVVKELDEKVLLLSQELSGRPVAYSKSMTESLAKLLSVKTNEVLNMASVPQLKTVLKDHFKVKLKIDRKTRKESTGEDSLNSAFAETGLPFLRHTLRTRELTKFLGTNIDAKRNKDIFYSCESVTGTVTGRRASRKTFLGWGSNAQNQTKHSDLGEKWQEVFIARPDHIFVYCDQASAEEWPVQGIIADVSGDTSGIRALEESRRSGISRHALLASRLFGLPLEQVNDKECLEYYIGKKVRHAGTYDMHGDKMAAEAAKEGFVIEKKTCDLFLLGFHEAEPNIQKVYQKWVQRELCSKRQLTTPFGRTRVFHGLRPYGDNAKIFREGYAQIPQSTVGDNNGKAILFMETHSPGLVLQDGHDSMLCETFDSFACVWDCVQLMRRAYDRELVFPNGFKVKIPVDFKIGFSIKGLKKCPDVSNEDSLRSTFETLHQRQNLQRNTICGVVSGLSQPHSSATSG